jgi:uncharacterized membrane protein YkoI
MKNKLNHAILASSLVALVSLLSEGVFAEAADIGFARAEQIALTQVQGKVREIEREHKLGREVYEVDVQTPEGKSFDVVIDAADGSVLKVKQDD